MFTKLLVSPLRLAIGWGAYPRFLGTIAVLMLILLRVTVGWHFYSEGVDKQSGSWSAEPFMANASGPFAEHFRSLVPDRDGSVRLDIDQTMQYLSVYRARAARHYRFDKDQQRQAKIAYVAAIKQIQYVLDTNAVEIEEYRQGRQRVLALQEDPVRNQVSSLRQQRDTIQSEWKRLAVPVLVKIDNIWTLYEKSINDIANDQQDQRGYFRLYKPASRATEFASAEAASDAKMAEAETDEAETDEAETDEAEGPDGEADAGEVDSAELAETESDEVESGPPLPRYSDAIWIDRINTAIPYFDVTIGICLMLGLFTPVMSLAAAAFLFSVFLSQYPPTSGPGSTNYQLIEAMACLVLAGTGAGRFAGLDFVLHALVRRLWPSEE